MNLFKEQFEDVTNVSMIEEERFNVTEHRGFLHGFVEAISVILVRFPIIYLIFIYIYRRARWMMVVIHLNKKVELLWNLRYQRFGKGVRILNQNLNWFPVTNYLSYYYWTISGIWAGRQDILHCRHSCHEKQQGGCFLFSSPSLLNILIICNFGGGMNWAP